MKRHALVIGGGIAGMSAALLLASQGVAVTLVEKAPKLAPLVRGFTRGGVHFDTGFHNTGYLAPGEALDRAFRSMGVSGLTSFALGRDGDQRVVVAGGPDEGYPLPSGFALARQTLGELFPTERQGLTAYLEAVRAAQESSPYLVSDGPVTAVPYPHATLEEVLDALFQDVRLKSLLASQIFYHGVLPDEVSFVFHARVGAAPLRSLHALDGGGEALALAFERALARAGVRVLTGAGVERIIVSSSGALSGVVLEGGEELAGEYCVSTVHPVLLARLVPRGVFRPIYVERLTKRPESPRVAMAFGLLPSGAHACPGRSWFFLDGHDPKRWFGEALSGGPGGLSIMISPAKAVSGRAGFELAACESARSSKEELLRRLVDSFTRMMPGHAAQAVFLDAAGPPAFTRFANSPFGSYYGPKHTAHCHGLQSRTKLNGLYLAGQAIVAPGVAGAVISACVCVDALLGTDAIRKELRSC